MVAAAVMLTVSAVLSPKKPVKHAEKLQSMWSSFDGSKRKGNASKRAQTKEATIVNKGSSSTVRGGRSEFMRVIRSDAEFIGTATAPIRKAMADIFWLRFLEKKPASTPKKRIDVVSAPPQPEKRDDVVTAPPQQEFPVLSPYPLGSSSVELMMADYESLKLYINYFWHSSKVLSTPMPEIYDPQAVADYFICRPHVLGFRIIEILFAFLTASVKLRASKRTVLEPDARNAKISTNFDGSKYYMGQLLKETLLYLGPTFIKVGQSLSTRPDIIGSEICEALSDLHDKVPPFPREKAMEIIEGELGCPLDHKFSYISDQTVAAASFGQVYKGCTTDGKIVALKVQRPDVLRSVVRDMYILRLGLGFLRKVAKRRSDIALYADELGKGFVGELDYTLEASNASTFLDAHSKYSFMVVPKVFNELTTKRVLTMEWMVGENPTKMISITKELPANSTSHYLDERKQLEAKSRLLDLVFVGLNLYKLGKPIETPMMYSIWKIFCINLKN